ncbi:hypothetical protein ES708_21677 [subsurface metagenome]
MNRMKIKLQGLIRIISLMTIAMELPRLLTCLFLIWLADRIQIILAQNQRSIRNLNLIMFRIPGRWLTNGGLTGDPRDILPDRFI